MLNVPSSVNCEGQAPRYPISQPTVSRFRSPVGASEAKLADLESARPSIGDCFGRPALLDPRPDGDQNVGIVDQRLIAKLVALGPALGKDPDRLSPFEGAGKGRSPVLVPALAKDRRWDWQKQAQPPSGAKGGCRAPQVDTTLAAGQADAPLRDRGAKLSYRRFDSGLCR